MSRITTAAAAALALAAWLTLPAVAQETLTTDAEGVLASASDRHVGYYYREPASEETYVARAQTLPDSDRIRRLEFVTLLTVQQFQAPYPPSLAIFAKGDDAEKLIMVALRDGIFDTTYRMRGVLAMMTASARTTDLFQQYGVADIFTFFDLLKLLGFEKLTLTDGRDLTHVVFFE